jgi:hypothetical protein
MSFHVHHFIKMKRFLWKWFTNLCSLVPFHHSSQPRLRIWWKGFGKISFWMFGSLVRLSDQLHRALEYFSSPPLSKQFQAPLTLSPTGTMNTFNRPWWWSFTHGKGEEWMELYLHFHNLFVVMWVSTELNSRMRRTQFGVGVFLKCVCRIFTYLCWRLMQIL